MPNYMVIMFDALNDITVKIIVASLVFAEMACAQEKQKAPPTVTIDAKLHRQKISYSNTYKHLKILEDASYSHDLLEGVLQINPKDKEVNMEGVVLKLVSQSVDITIPVDQWGCVFLPLHSQAYEENANIVANRGEDALNFRVSIQVKSLESKQYTLAYLEEACEQLRASLDKENPWFSSLGRQMRNSHCIGVDILPFNGNKDAPPRVKFIANNRETESLPASEKSTRIAFKDWKKEGYFFMDAYPILISLVVEKKLNSDCLCLDAENSKLLLNHFNTTIFSFPFFALITVHWC